MCLASVRRAGHVADVLGAAVALADIRVAQGRLSDALRTYDRRCSSPPAGWRSLCGERRTCHVGMAEIYRERDDLQAAAQHLLRSEELGEHTGLPQNPYRWRVAMARIRQAEGDLHGALDLLDEAERLYVGDFSPNVRPVPAWGTGLVGQGSWMTRLAGLGEPGCPSRTTSATCTSSSTSPWPECSWLSTQHDGARRLPPGGDPTPGASPRCGGSGRRTGSVIEILVLQALAHQARGDLPAALAPLQRALTLAEPEGYVRVFVDEGQPWPPC